MGAELKERILACLRGLDVGESISADGIADEIGEKLSDVYDVLETLENEHLAEMHSAVIKGGDPTYTLTPKGKRAMQTEAPAPVGDCTCQYCGTVMASPARKRNHEPVCGSNPNRNQQTKDMTDKGKKAKETRIHTKETLVECPDCHRMVKRISMHKSMGGCKPLLDVQQVVAEAEDLPVSDVPDVSEYAFETETGPVEPAPDYSPANNGPALDERTERVIGRVEDAVGKLIPASAMVLKGSPGMAAVLRLIGECQSAIADGADVLMNVSVRIAPGFEVSICLDIPDDNKGANQ